METAEKTIASTEEVGAVSMSPSTSLLDILRSDAAGLPITDMLRQSAMLCSGMGGGPLEDRLWLMAEELEPYMSNASLEPLARKDHQ